MNYLGYNVDKCWLSDNFLPQAEYGELNPDITFIGNPRNKNAFGANAPVIVNTANDYLNSVSSELMAYDLSGTEFSKLLDYVIEGYPVIIWGTLGMQKSYYVKGILNDQEIQWLSHFHCVVLIGYTENTYIIADPREGIVEYNKKAVEERYKDLSQQAVIIY